MKSKISHPVKQKLSAARFIVLSTLVFTLLPNAIASAWLDTGHKIISIIVWDELTPTARAKIIEILKQHPRYEKDLLNGLPQGADEAATARFAVANAAIWPDLIRGAGHPMHFVADHPNWHYINIPYSIDNTPIPATQPTTRADNSNPGNVVEALDKNTHDLKDPSISGPDKAIALCWVLHLCGDIHQPLHACTLYSSQFPGGDQGGNAVIVLRDPPYPSSKMNLHFIWDSMPGQYKSLEMDNYIAQGLRSDPRFSRDRLKGLLAVKDFAAWANESHRLAIEYAYLNGTLKGASAAQLKADPMTPIPGLPSGYLEQAEKVAGQQVILAGYRTADLLNSIFDPK